MTRSSIPIAILALALMACGTPPSTRVEGTQPGDCSDGAPTTTPMGRSTALTAGVPWRPRALRRTPGPPTPVQPTLGSRA